MKLPRPKARLLRAMHWLAAPCLLLALWLPACNQGDFRTDTGLYAAIAKLMYQSALARGSLGPFWFPMLGDAPYFNKPPLPFWFHGAFIHAFGPELWATRLPTLLAAVGAVVALQRAVRALAGPASGLFAALVLATTLEFFRYTRAISLDVWLVMFMLLATASAAAAARRRTPLRFVRVGVWVGLGLLVKPLYALAVLAIIAAWLMWSPPERHAEAPPPRPGSTASSRGRWLAAVALAAAVALVIAAPWYLSMYARWGDAFLQEHFVRQTLERAVGAPPQPGDAERTAWRSPLDLAAEFASTYWPWLITLTLALAAFLRRGAIGRAPRLDRLAVAWSLLLALGLMLFAGKRSRYMVPLYPGLAMLSAAWIAGPALSAPRPAGLRRHARRAVTLWAPALPFIVLAGALTLTTLGVTPHKPPSGDIEALQSTLRDAAAPTTWVAPGAQLNAARLYVKGSPWPRALVTPGTDPRDPRPLPAAGDVVLFSNDTITQRPYLLRPHDHVLTSNAGMTAVRAGSPWTRADLDALTAPPLAPPLTAPR